MACYSRLSYFDEATFVNPSNYIPRSTTPRLSQVCREWPQGTRIRLTFNCTCPSSLPFAIEEVFLLERGGGIGDRKPVEYEVDYGADTFYRSILITTDPVSLTRLGLHGKTVWVYVVYWCGGRMGAVSMELVKRRRSIKRKKRIGSRA